MSINHSLRVSQSSSSSSSSPSGHSHSTLGKSKHDHTTQSSPQSSAMAHMNPLLIDHSNSPNIPQSTSTAAENMNFVPAHLRPLKRPKIDSTPRQNSSTVSSQSHHSKQSPVLAKSSSLSSLSSLSSNPSSLSSSPQASPPLPSQPSPSSVLVDIQPPTQSSSLNHSQLKSKSDPSPPSSSKSRQKSISSSHNSSEKTESPCTGDPKKEASDAQTSSSASSQLPPALIHQKLKFGSRQQALALNQAILRRQAEQKDQAPHTVTQFNSRQPVESPYAHLNVPSGRLTSQSLTQSSRILPSSNQPGRRHHPSSNPPDRKYAPFSNQPPRQNLTSSIPPGRQHHSSWPHRSSSTASPAGQLAHAPLIASNNLNSNRPVCIGLLSSLVLILYRLKEFEIDICGPDGKVQPQTLPVRLCRFPPNGTNEILKVLSPSGEQFGVVEHKIGNVIGPLLGPVNSISGGSAVGGWTPKSSPQVTDASAKVNPDLSVPGILDDKDDDITEISGPGGSKVNQLSPPLSPGDGRQLFIECCVIRRGEQNPMMLPLQLLLFCLPEAVPSISAYFTRSLVTLEHPVSYHPEMHLGCLYDNPHSCQPREAMETIRHRLLGSSNHISNNQNLQPPVQICDNHQQVATIFKSLASGVDLDETEPSDLIITPLYPHQKQALSFMLDRETSKVVPDDTKSARSSAEKRTLEREDEENLLSLWKKTRDTYGRHVGWVNVVTGIQQIGRHPPTQCRGALLADDMGLGKTISIISLIATTLEAAIEYTKTPITQPAVQVTSSQKSCGTSAQASKIISGSDEVVETQPSFSLFEKLQDSRVKLPAATVPKQKKEGITAAKKRIAAHDRFHLVKVKSRATLIVCPLSTVQNWESQIEEHVRKKQPSKDSNLQAPVPSLSVCVYHGNSRTNDVDVLANHDVVITTYSLLGYEFSRQNRSSKEAEDDHHSSDCIEEIDCDGKAINPGAENEEKPTNKKRVSHKRKRKCDGLPSPLQAIQWFRVVLDEAHMIKEHSTTQSKAACDLLAERRVCLTGTPLQNSLNDLFSLVCFLRLDPFTDRAVWSTHIGTPARLGEPLGVSRLQLIMRHIALRRTKQTCDKHGKPILTLPPKKDDIVYLELSQSEKEVYSKYHQRSRNTFMSLKKEDTVLKNYCSILQELLRLRQICAHVGLVYDSEAQSGRETDLALQIEQEGFSKSKASKLLVLMRDTGVTQCSECGKETISASTTENEQDFEDLKVVNSKRGGRKKMNNSKKTSTGNKVSDEMDVKETQLTSVITKCQHLFCPQCYRECMYAKLRSQGGSQEDVVECSVCSQQLAINTDVVEVSTSELQESIRLEELQNIGSENIQPTENGNRADGNKKGKTRKPRTLKLKGPEAPLPNLVVENKLEICDSSQMNLIVSTTTGEAKNTIPPDVKSDINTIPLDVKPDTNTPTLQHGTKITQLLLDLLPFSQANPASANFAPHNPVFTQDLDSNDPEADYKPIKGTVVKSVVFSQWTKLLDKIAIALDEFKIQHRRLDGTMNRTERNRSMDALKTDPKVEVLLVSLRAGGVGLNLTCAQRVYLMEPFWNPAVENQAVDRVHRLGQTKPVRMIRYIISGSVEQNMLEIQKRKTELANMSLGQTLSKAELAKRRVEDLHILFKENINS